MLKQDVAYFWNSPESEITDKLLNGNEYNNSHLDILSELFNAEAELAMELHKMKI